MTIWHIYERRFWWSAVDVNAPVATIDTPTYYRAWTRQRLIAKLRRKCMPKGPHVEILEIDDSGQVTYDDERCPCGAPYIKHAHGWRTCAAGHYNREEEGMTP